MSIYYHKHHIIPKHMGGSNDPSNLVLVTVEQHANLHKQLWEDLGHEEDRIAWLCLSGQITTQEATLSAIRMARAKSKGVKRNPLSEDAKRKISESKKGKKINYPKGRKSRSDDDKKAVSEKMKGELNHFFGKKHTIETRKKISEAVKANNQNEVFTGPVDSDILKHVA